MVPSPQSVRGILAVLVVLSAATLVVGYVEAHRTSDRITGDPAVEVDTAGEVVWAASIGFPYESERLGTGDESAGGHSAASLGLESRSASDAGVAGFALPPTVANAVSYVFPRWIGAVEGFALAVFLVTAPAWLFVEYRRSGIAVSIRSPFSLDRK